MSHQQRRDLELWMAWSCDGVVFDSADTSAIFAESTAMDCVIWTRAYLTDRLALIKVRVGEVGRAMSAAMWGTVA